MPRRFVIMTIAGLLGASFLAVGLAVGGAAALGAFVFGVACLGTLVTVVFAKRSRSIDRPGVSPRRGEVTRRELRAVPLPPSSRQICTADVPTRAADSSRASRGRFVVLAESAADRPTWTPLCVRDRRMVYGVSCHYTGD